MIAPAGLWDGLIDDAAMFPPGNAAVGDAVAAHLDYRAAWFASLIGPLVVSDQRLAEVGRAASSELAVSVINTGGAGGVVALARRPVAGVRVVAVESALRDLDDLAGNAGRVAAAAAELDENVRVFVEIPYAPGWERAVEEVEAAGLLGKIRTGGVDPADTPSADQLAEQLSVLVEADLPFKATAGLHHAWPTAGQHGFVAVLVALEALIDGAEPRDAAALLTRSDVSALAGWTDLQAARVRRRFLSFGCCGVLDRVHDLAEAGLIETGSIEGGR